MISVFAGTFLFFTKIRFPEIIGNTLSSVDMIGPLNRHRNADRRRRSKESIYKQKNLPGHIHPIK